MHISDDKKILDLKEKYKAIRNLTYLTLDSHYAPVGMRIDLHAILLEAELFATRVFTSTASEFQQLTRSFQQYLENVIYSSPESIWVFMEFRSRFLRVFETNFSTSDEKAFFSYLSNLRRATSTFKLRSRPVYTRIPASISPIPTTIKPISVALDLQKQMGLTKDCVCVKGSAMGTTQSVYIYHQRNAKFEQTGQRLGAIAQILARDAAKLEKQFRGLPLRYRYQRIATVVQDFFRSIFYLTFSDNYEIVIERSGIPEYLNGFFASTRPNARRLSAEILSTQFVKQLPQSRKLELTAVANCIETIPGGGTYSACLANIKITRKKNPLDSTHEEHNVAEIDGVVFLTNKRSTKLLIVEAKGTGIASIGDATRQLEELRDSKVEWHEGLSNRFGKIIPLSNRTGAVLPIRLA